MSCRPWLAPDLCLKKSKCWSASTFAVSDLLLGKMRVGEESARACPPLLPGPAAGLAHPTASHQQCFILSTHPSNVSFGHSFCAMSIAQPNGFALLVTSLCVMGVVYGSCQRPTFRTARLEQDRALRRAARLSPACLWDLGYEVGTHQQSQELHPSRQPVFLGGRIKTPCNFGKTPNSVPKQEDSKPDFHHFEPSVNHCEPFPESTWAKQGIGSIHSWMCEVKQE